MLLRAAEAHTLEYLATVRDRMTAAGVADVELSAWYGTPVESIVEAARFRDADLIVMSSHGRSGVAWLVMGSVTETVLRATTVPVLVIRPDGAPLATPFTPTAKEVAHV